MNPKIVCIGSNIESEICLRAFMQAGVPVMAFITRPAGKPGAVSDYVDLHPLCQEHNILPIDTVNVNAEETLKEIAALGADYLFTLGWSQIFSEPLIKSFSKLVIGSHPSILPEGRGRAPVPWTVLEDKRRSAVSFFEVNAGADSGKIMLQKFFDIPERPYAYDVYKLVAEHLAQGFIELYQTIATGKDFSFIEQDESKATHRGKRTKEDGLIDFSASAEEIDRLVRAVSFPFPGAYSFYQDRKIIFWEAQPDHETKYSGTVGQILKKKDRMLLVQTGRGILWLGNPTDELGQEINMDQFKIDSKFGYNVQEEIYQLKKLFSKNV